jgi:dynactin complex subunit
MERQTIKTAVDILDQFENEIQAEHVSAVLIECAEENARYENQIALLKAELKKINAALDDPRTDLTHTASEVVILLKQQLYESQKDTERLNYLVSNHVYRLCGTDSWIIGFHCGSNPFCRDAVDVAIRVEQQLSRES